MTAFNRNNGKNTATIEPEVPAHFTVHLGDEAAAEHHVEPDPVPLGIPGTPTWSSDSLKAQVEQNNSGLRDRLLARLEHMDPGKLASCLGTVLARLGYGADSPPKTVDGELEFNGTLTVGGAIANRLAVHVRRHGGAQLGVDAVRALRGCLELEEQGLLVTTGDFSDAARAEATAAGRRQISLMNGQQIAKLMLDFEIGVEATMLKVYDVTLD
ncbi:MAG: restriction endonuclease [bacterium]|nr:restriction endonuclease [bacterium]